MELKSGHIEKITVQRKLNHTEVILHVIDKSRKKLKLTLTGNLLDKNISKIKTGDLITFKFISNQDMNLVTYIKSCNMKEYMESK